MAVSDSLVRDEIRIKVNIGDRNGRKLSTWSIYNATHHRSKWTNFLLVSVVNTILNNIQYNFIVVYHIIGKYLDSEN